MCIQSVIMKYGLEQVSSKEWNPKSFDHFQEMLRQAAIFDAMTNQPHCEDQHKKKALEDIQKSFGENI